MNQELFIILLVCFVFLFIMFARIFWRWHQIYKQRREVIPPGKIVSKTLTPKYQLMYGSSYLIMDKGAREGVEQGFKIFKGNLHQGASGLCIARTYPDKIRIRYKLEDVPVIWLSRSGGQELKPEKVSESDFKVIKPTKLGMLLEEIKDFIHTRDDTIIMFEGVEYLIVHNDFSRVLKFIHGLEDEIALHRSRLILVINPKVLEDKDRALLEKEFKVLSFSDKGRK